MYALAAWCVIDANKLQHCYLLAHWHLHNCLSASATAFASGLAQVRSLQPSSSCLPARIMDPAWIQTSMAQQLGVLLTVIESIIACMPLDSSLAPPRPPRRLCCSLCLRPRPGLPSSTPP